MNYKILKLFFFFFIWWLKVKFGGSTSNFVWTAHRCDETRNDWGLQCDRQWFGWNFPRSMGLCPEEFEAHMGSLRYGPKPQIRYRWTMDFSKIVWQIPLPSRQIQMFKFQCWKAAEIRVEWVYQVRVSFSYALIHQMDLVGHSQEPLFDSEINR